MPASKGYMARRVSPVWTGAPHVWEKELLARTGHVHALGLWPVVELACGSVAQKTLHLAPMDVLHVVEVLILLPLPVRLALYISLVTLVTGGSSSQHRLYLCGEFAQ